MTRIFAIVLALAALAGAGDALARGMDEDDEVRVALGCSRSSSGQLRLRRDDGELRLELRVDTNRVRALWRVVVLHERRLAFRGPVRTSSSGSLRVRLELRDWFGRDTFVARASGPSGETCRATASI